jgi:predicted Zn-dependent protease
MDARRMKDLVEPYRAAFSQYEQGETKAALKQFKELAKKIPGDTPTQIMIERCDYVLAHPNWDRITDLKSK